MTLHIRRKEQSQPNEKNWKRLVRTLQLVAADPKDIAIMFAPSDCFAKDWPLQMAISLLDGAEFVERQKLAAAQLQSLKGLDAVLQSLSCDAGALHWHSSQPEPDPRWSEVREKARSILRELGLELRTRRQWLLWG